MNKTIAFNITHDASACKCSGGDIEVFLEEERLSRIKNDEYPVKTFLKLIEPGCSLGFTGLDYNDEINVSKKVNELTPIISKKFGIHPDEIVTVTQHHALHALCGFYNSGFEEACVVVVDGMGNHIDYDYHEAESVFNVKYPSDATLLVRNVCARSDSNNIQLRDIHGEWPIGIGMVYSSISSFLGFGSLGCGKVMGLAPYGIVDNNIKPFVLEDGSINSRLFYRTFGGANFIPYDYLPTHWNFTEWDEKLQRIANLAYRLQKDFETYMINLLQQAVRMSGSKNLILTGGCALNCVANYEYLNHLPKDINFYVEPVSNDAGTSIGLAKLMYYKENNS